MEEKYIVRDTYGDYELFNTLDKAEEYFNSTLEFWRGEEDEGFEEEPGTAMGIYKLIKEAEVVEDEEKDGWVKIKIKEE